MSGMTRWGFAPLLIIGFLFMTACSGTGQQAAFAQVCDGQVNPEITVTVPPSKPV